MTSTSCLELRCALQRRRLEDRVNNHRIMAQAVISEDCLLGSFESSFKAILDDEDNVISGSLAPKGSILIQATYETGKVVIPQNNV